MQCDLKCESKLLLNCITLYSVSAKTGSILEISVLCRLLNLYSFVVYKDFTITISCFVVVAALKGRKTRRFAVLLKCPVGWPHHVSISADCRPITFLYFCPFPETSSDACDCLPGCSELHFQISSMKAYFNESKKKEDSR